ncbi:hypothetical protein SEA_PHONEGINGI_54 [Microbacterium phage Phonegingi]|nr:hypothetical protein SEA_PHONEGINGI_54 [Microbacterium phage Phonegingi]
MSEHFERALADWREARAEYENVLHADYEAAADACRDRLVNAKGRRLGIDPMSLFMGNRARAYAYASEELIEWWETHPRTPFVEFERRWLADRDERDAQDIRQSIEWEQYMEANTR